MIEPLPNFALIWSKAFSEAARLAAFGSNKSSASLAKAAAQRPDMPTPINRKVPPWF